jgi:para-aminobenzoate synthetase component 1
LVQQFHEIIYLDSNDYPQIIRVMIVFSLLECIYFNKTDYHNAFEDLKYQQSTKELAFGYLSYDLKK